MRGGLNFYETSNAIMMEMFQEHINDNDNDRFRSLEEKQLKQKQQELAEQQQKVEESLITNQIFNDY